MSEIDFTLPVKEAGECSTCAMCGEPWCDEHDMHYADCSHPGPHSEQECAGPETTLSDEVDEMYRVSSYGPGVDINKHPVLVKAYQVCLAIEAFPASELQSRLKEAADDLLYELDLLVDSLPTEPISG